MASFIDTAVPEGARPAVRVLVKHHFWALSVLVPLVLLPLLFAGSGAISEQIESRRQEIDVKISQVKKVASMNPHPNEEWSKAIDSQTDTLRREIDEEWKRLWESQAALRVWPEELGNDFLEEIGRLRSNEQLPRALLQRYQTNCQRLVRVLPRRMGVPPAVDMVADGAAPGGGMVSGRDGMAPGMMTPGGRGPGIAGLGGGPGAVPSQPAATMIWNPADQTRIAQSFAWTTVPSTRQVLMAQERLWVYGLFCDLLREFTKGATGPHDSPVALVDEIAISHDAAEPVPGGMAENRLALVPVPQGADAGMGRMAVRGMRLQAGSGSEGMGGAGPGMGGAGPGMMDASTGPAANAGLPGDAELLSYAYVDFGGRALTAEELATAPGAEMTHLMPFVLRVVIDERQIDALLMKLAESVIPIDVRQIRINPGAAGQPAADGGTTAAVAVGVRLHDVRLELRGTVALATKPVDPVSIAPAAVIDEGRVGDRIRQMARHERRVRWASRSEEAWS